MAAVPFEVICEVEPATRPDLMRVRHQIGVLSPVASRFLIPDNHIGRATVSSIAVAHEVGLMGGRAIACVNARDRNRLGFRRDLLTAAAYGVRDFLFVYGDRPETGKRSDDLNVEAMIAEARDFAETQGGEGPLRIGVSCRLGSLPPWKHQADSLFVQVSYSVDDLCRWRSEIEFDGAVYPGVMALPSVSMARKLGGDVPELAPPADVLARLEGDLGAGVALATEMVADLRDAGCFDGVHLIPVSRYREVAAALAPIVS
jgi:5,10-methylenetetrahydrofolate reductase